MNENTQTNYVAQLLELFRGSNLGEDFQELLNEYHDSDIADALEQLSEEERARVYPLIGAERLAEIFAYIEDADEYLQEISAEDAAEIIENMDSEDAADVLDEMDEESKQILVDLLDEETSRDIEKILSYEDDEIGSEMSTDFVVIKRGLSVRGAMSELVSQAGENDNILTLYVVNEDETFYGAIDLKDLIRARKTDDLEDIISTTYPYISDRDKIGECLERIKDYAEDSIPVLDSTRKIVGVFTSQDIVEVVDDEMGDDYAKLAGLTAEEDLNETTTESMRKRLPWLIVLLVLGLGVSSVVGVFETVVAVLPLIICFQSLILDMAGNVGTQSLAVTIRVLMDENLTGVQKVKLVFKEVKVGLSNGLFLGTVAFVFVSLYIYIFKDVPLENTLLIAGCVGVALMVTMIISSLVGTLVPMFFHRIHVDPAVASGPLITTVNDLVAVVTYYGLSWLLLINILHIV